MYCKERRFFSKKQILMVFLSVYIIQKCKSDDLLNQNIPSKAITISQKLNNISNLKENRKSRLDKYSMDSWQLEENAQKEKLLFETATKINQDFCMNENEEGYYSDLLSNCRLYHICKTDDETINSLDAFKMTTETLLCPVGSRFDMIELICKAWYEVDCKAEYVPFQLLQLKENNSKLRKRRPKYLKHYQNTDNDRDSKKYNYLARVKRKPGSCYRCCVPYPKPSNHYTTKRPRPTNSWHPRPTRYTTTTRRPYTWTPYPASWVPTRSTASYYPIYVPAITTSRPNNNIAVIDAVAVRRKMNGSKNKTFSFNKKQNSVTTGNYNSNYHHKRQNEYYKNHSPASQVYLNYKRHPPGGEDFVIVENNQRPVEVLDLLQKNP